MAEVGLVLMDTALHAIAVDRGAASILNFPSEAGGTLEVGPYFPAELMEAIRHLISSDLPYLTHPISVGKCEYFCHVYRVEPQDPALTRAIVAVHFGKSRPVSNAVNEAGIAYRLTARELDALRGVSMGLGNKELAELMKISPNTVKAFLRLIMIKMNVSTRTGLVAKILQKRTDLDEQLRGTDVHQASRRLTA
jgi:DNA-binding NarL/FixJ family response regulator